MQRVRDTQRIPRMPLVSFVSLSLCVGILFAASLAGCDAHANAAPGAGKSGKGRLLVLGMDGMDPKILGTLMEQGLMPNFSAVARQGTFRPLATAMPPQSPVAWSNLISGGTPGKHQIFDFIHRELPQAKPGEPFKGLPVMPVFSTAKTEALDHWYFRWLPDSVNLPFAKDWQIPLKGEEPHSLRRGDSFWDFLVANGVDTQVYRIPANYPSDKPKGPGAFAAVTGMGTPDLLSGYGTFTKFAENGRTKSVGGGRLAALTVINHRATGYLEGPANFLRKTDGKSRPPDMKLRLEFARDPENDLVKIMIPAEQVKHPKGASPLDEPYQQVLMMAKGEWSDWVPIAFETGVPAGWLLSTMTLPTTMPGMVRFYVMDVHPELKIYVSPIQMDPLAPANPVSQPGDFAAKLAERFGRYYTVGIPEDTSALKSGAINEDEFLAIGRLILEEKKTQYRAAIQEFKRGMLFFYFGSTDQWAHIFWRDRDPDHPGLREGEMEKYGRVLETLYQEMDGLLGEALRTLRDEDTLMIVSDHGFGSFRRGFNVNTWLLANEYLTIREDVPQRAGLGAIDWSQTKAYALGINSLYINVKGREALGIVGDGDERKKLLREIGEKLMQYRDIDGAAVIKSVYYTDEFYPGADPKVAPDLLIGYNTNYRGSWETTLGDMPENIVDDNMQRWSGDHCVASDLVPGILVSNRKVTVDDPALSDIGATILDVFGIAKPPSMTGRAILEK